MTSKDLLFALQTRNKHMIRELDEFASNVKNSTLEEAWIVVAETIKLVEVLPPTQVKYSHIIKAVNRAWLAFCERSPTTANRLYDVVIKTLEETTWKDTDEAQVAYQLIYAFHYNHFRSVGANAHLHLALMQNSSRILDLIKRIAAYSTQELFLLTVKPHTGIGADAIEMLLEIYLNHTRLDQGNELRADAARLILPLVQSNPTIGNNKMLFLLRFLPKRAVILSQLIELYVLDGVHENMRGMFYGIMLDLVNNSGDSFIYNDLDKIAAQIEVYSKQWTGKQLDAFARYAFFYKLKTDEDRRLLISKSKKAMHLAKLIVSSGHTGTYIDNLRSLYHSIVSRAADPAPARLGAYQFKDLNFKLLVIEELMYIQKKLLPRFDVYEFVRQYTDREIMIKKEGYDVIPEVLAYFEEMLIPSSLLEQVEELEFDGSNEIYHQIFPYWDGECDTFDVTSPEDIELVPNLKCMSSMPAKFIEKYAVELGKKSIEVSHLA